MTKCKHNIGWLTIKDAHIFVWKDGKVRVGWTGKNKLVFRCNIPECNAIRNGYLKAEIKFGKIRKNPVPEGK